MMLCVIGRRPRSSWTGVRTTSLLLVAVVYEQHPFAMLRVFTDRSTPELRSSEPRPLNWRWGLGPGDPIDQT